MLKPKTSIAEIKEIIRTNYPFDMIYKRAMRLKVGTGRRRRSYKRTLAYSKDHTFSVELIGQPDGLKNLLFMTSSHDGTRAAQNLSIIEIVLKNVRVGGFDEEMEIWMRNWVAMGAVGETKREGITCSRDQLAGIPVIFVRA